MSSHPQALLQCTRYLNGLTEAAVEAYTDTAMAVERVASLGDPTRAAVASAEAAERYGLEVIERHIANQRENYTRFVIVARRPATFDLALACKSSLVFAAHHERGALLAALQILNEHHLNLTKLESRPRPGSPWEYLFYVDFEGNSADPVVAGALQALRGATSYLKFLGSYPARQHERSHEAPLPEGYEPGTRPIDPATPRPARQVRARGIVFGGPDPVVIASVPHLEDGAPAHRAARALYERGARVLLVAEPTAESARRWASAAAQTNMMVAHRCDDIEHIEAAIGVADVVLIPGEATEDTALLHRAGRSDVVVLLERPAVASVEAWLAKAQVVVDAGNARVVLVDAGVQAVAGGERRVLDLAGIAEAIAVSGYPVIVDPATYVRFAAGSLEAIAAAGAAGLLVRGQRDQVLRPR